MSRVWKTPWQTLFCGFFGLKAFRLLGLLGLLGTVSVVYAQGAAPVVVDAHRVSESRKTHALTLPGTLEAHEFVVIRPEVAGRLTAFHFEEGAHVHKDQVLIRLDDRLEQAAVAQAKAQVQLALSAHKRASTLSGKGFESRLVLEEAQAKLAVAQAELDVAQARLARRTLKAPFEGHIGFRTVSLGDYVKEGADLVRLDALDRLRIEVFVPERYLSLLGLGQTLELRSDAFPGHAFQAVITHIAPTVEASTRSVAVRAALDNPERLLRPGLFVRLRWVREEARPAVWIPEDAIVNRAQGAFVFRIDADHKARLVNVATGLRQEGEVMITEGLQPGEDLVLAGHHKLRDGQTVRIRTTPTGIQ